jgi:hypothetical protein
VRCGVVEYAAWCLVARRLGWDFSAWARRALNEQAELDLALLREREFVDGGSSDGGRVGV